MAEVYVSSWSEFVEAIGVAGDTVILPEEAEWDMNEILPYGLQGDITFACKKIDGRGTRIKNLNLNNYVFIGAEQDIKVLHNLLMTDWIGTNQWFTLSYGSEWFRCAISGITSASIIIYNQNSYSYSGTEMASCAINVESSASRFQITSDGANMRYCRVEVHAPNSDTGELGNAEYFCCELAFFAPNATISISVYKFQNGNLLRGNLKSVPELEYARWVPWSGLTSVFDDDTFSDTLTSPFPQNFVSCTEDQLKDAAYLRSLGFPIVVG